MADLTYSESVVQRGARNLICEIERSLRQISLHSQLFIVSIPE